jgi:hypothetical protein
VLAHAALEFPMSAPVPVKLPHRLDRLCTCSVFAVALWLAAFTAAFTSVSTSAHAQQIRGTVTDSVTGRPVAGAVVMMQDDAGNTRSRNITNERGQYFFALTPDLTTMRIMRIGFRPSIRQIRERNDLVTVDIAMSPLSTILAPIQVSAARTGGSRVGPPGRCPQTPDQAATDALLEQARAGLLAVVVARESNPSDQNRLGFVRIMDGTSDKVVRQTVHHEFFPKSRNSFKAARSADEFVREGFRQTVEGEALYMAPDVDVLLSDDFSTAYCFRIAKSEKERERQVGLQFRPSGDLNDPKRNTTVVDSTGEIFRYLVQGRVDVEGTLWIDTSANAVREIEFRYVGVPRTIRAFEPGGTIRFQSIKNGVTLVDRWTLRTVGARQETSENEFARRQNAGRLQVSETGGELARAEWADSTTYVASLGTAAVTVVDDKNLPVPGVRVRFLNTDYSGITDSLGKLIVSDLVPGPYRVGFDDERLRRIGLNVETKIAFQSERGTQSRIVLKRRTGEQLIAEKCGSPSIANAVPLIAGRVLAPDADVTKAKVFIVAEISPGSWKRLEESFEVDTDGYYFLCPRELKLDATVRLEVEGGTIETAVVTEKLSERLVVIDIPVVPKRRR